MINDFKAQGVKTILVTEPFISDHFKSMAGSRTRRYTGQRLDWKSLYIRFLLRKHWPYRYL